MLSLIEKIFNYFMYGIMHQNIPKLRQFSMPKQDKELLGTLFEQGN